MRFKLEEVAVTTPSNLSAQSIEDYAKQVGEAHAAYSDSGVLDIDHLISQLGGRTEYAENNESLHVSKPGLFTVFIPHFTSGRRDRFTKAHELGHYFLHYLYPQQQRDTTFARGGRNRAETEANIFAASLLMPAVQFREFYDKYEGDAWKLANHFGVSPAAASVRAKVLNLN